MLVCTHATFRFALAELGIEAFDGRLIAVDEFHHVSADPENRPGASLGQLIARNRVHLIAMTGSYFRGDAVAVFSPEDEAKFVPVTYTHYQQLNGYEHLKSTSSSRSAWRRKASTGSGATRADRRLSLRCDSRQGHERGPASPGAGGNQRA